MAKRSGRHTGRRRAVSDSDPSGSFSPLSSGWESLGDLSDSGDAPAPKPKKKPKKSGRASGRSKSVGRASGKSKRASGRRTTGRARAGARPTGHVLIPVVCSECFEELAFDTGVKSDTLTCPICEHSASRPDDGTLARIAELRRAERTNGTIALALLLIGFLGFLSFAVVQANPANAGDDAMFWGPIGVGGLCAFILLGFAFKYEGNRWEIYF